MKIWLLIPIAMLTLAAAGCRGPLSPSLESVEGNARIDHRELRYRVWLPAGYHDHPERRYPLLVWFHGGGENEDGWGRVGRIGEIARMRVQGGALKPFIVVSPSAGSFTPIYRGYEKVLLERVLPEVREKYRTTDAAVAFGHSMGGLSALSISMRNPGLFRAVALASPFVFDTRPWDLPEEKRAYDAEHGGMFVGRWRWELELEFDGPEDYEQWDPFQLARRRAHELDFKLLITSGDEDPLGLLPHNRHLHERLTHYGVEHEWYVQEGIGHGTVEDPYILKWLNDHSH